MVKAGKSVQLKDLRQQCLDLGLRDIGGKKVTPTGPQGVMTVTAHPTYSIEVWIDPDRAAVEVPWTLGTSAVPRSWRRG